MKFKKFILMLAIFVCAFAGVGLTACGNSAGNNVQQLNYTESVAKINNPDQGFYRPISVKVTESGVTYNKNIVNSSTQLYHLRIDISAFSAIVNGNSDKQLTQSALDGLEEVLAYIRSQDKNAVVRFAYDPSYGGSKDKEPSMQMILSHIAQVCPILNGYVNTVTAIEAGLIGPWGEMHSSAIATSANITSIIDAFLTNTDDIPVLVRTPKMIYDYIGITVNDIDMTSVSATDKAYRLGLFNDGYLGSNNDLGTYTDREREVEFLSSLNEHLPYGGEVVAPTSTLHDIEVCLPEMNKLKLSYLNVEWNNLVIDKWKNSEYTSVCGADKIYYGSTAFTYIENHMGYRFVLTRSVIDRSGNNGYKIELKLKNVGFGNLNKTKRAEIVLTDESGAIAYSQEVGNFVGENTFSCTFAHDLADGKYDVYLRLFGEQYDSMPLYCLQFANDGLWNATLKANKIGIIQINR